MTSKNDLALFVFVDALGWELVRDGGFLDDLWQTRAPVASVLGYSCTCGPTILTGTMPREHGHFSFFRYAPESSPFDGLGWLDALPRTVTGRSRVRHWISRAVRNRLGYTGYFNLYDVPFRELRLFDYSEKRDLYAPGGILGGVPTIFDLLRERDVPFHLTDWRRGEDQALESAARDLETGVPRFAYLYLPRLDGLLHAVGKGGRGVADKLAWYEQALRALLRRIRPAYRDVRVTLFSDHGMADVHATCDLRGELERSGLVFERDYVAVFDSTMARFWFARPEARDAVGERLAHHPQGRILSDEELVDFGCDFDDRRYGELIFLLEPGTLLCPSHMGARPIAGMHGYDPADPASAACLLSTEEIANPPERLDGLFALMAAEAERAAEASGAAA